MADDPRMAEYEARKKATAEANAKATEAMAMPPTPTQEENDMAAMGIHSDKPAESSRSVPRHETQPHRTETSRA